MTTWGNGDCTTPWVIEFVRRRRSNNSSVEDDGCLGLMEGRGEFG